MTLPTAVSLREVGPRDGLQNEDPVPTDAKVALINGLSRTGVSRIEAVSFVHPRAIPQMADADEAWARVERNPAVTYSALVPNSRGASRAIDAGFTDIEVVVSASDTHNRRNVNRSTDDSLADVAEIIKQVHDAGGNLEVIVSTAWGCPYEGEVPVSRVVDVARRAVDAGADALTYGDTTGMATPTRVIDLVTRTRETMRDVPLALHFHNTRGMGLANVVAGLQAGVVRFEGCLGGLGGCPFAPGATGNVCTEDVVHMLESMGCDTGVDLDRLLAASRRLREIVGHEMPGQVVKAGKSSDVHPVPSKV